MIGNVGSEVIFKMRLKTMSCVVDSNFTKVWISWYICSRKMLSLRDVSSKFAK